MSSDKSKSRQPLSPPNPAERRRIRRVSIMCGVGVASLFLIDGVIGRVGALKQLPWLQITEPGSLDPAWWVHQAAISLVTGVAFSYIFSKMLRFPNTPTDKSAA